MNYTVAIVKELKKLAPEGRVTAGTVRLLADRLYRTTQEAKVEIAQRYADDIGVIMNIGPLEIQRGSSFLDWLTGSRETYDERVESIFKDLQNARLRAKEYEAVVSKMDDDEVLSDDIEAFTRPLYRNVLSSEQSKALVGVPFNSPDLMTPIVALDEYGAFGPMVESRYRDLFQYVESEAAKVAGLTKNYGALIIGAAAILGAAIYFGGRR